MLFSTTLTVLATSTVAFGHVVRWDGAQPNPDVNSEPVAHQTADDLNVLEHVANSRVPQVTLPDQISESTKQLIQFMAIWTEIEMSVYHNTSLAIAQGANGYTDFRNWNKTEVTGILNTNQAESQLWMTYTLSLLTHYNLPDPSGCRIKSPLGGIELVRDLLSLQELNTLFIDSFQNASSTIESSLLPLFWSISTSRAEQNGFYRLFNNEIPSERAFLTSLPASLAYSSITQVLRDCPFSLSSIYPVAAPLFADYTGPAGSPEGAYCANLTHAIDPADLSSLYLSINVGLQEPLVVKVDNATLNGTIIEFEANYPKDEAILNGLVNTALIGKGGEELATAWIQMQEPLEGDHEFTPDIICPQSGGTLFWDFISE